MRTLRLPHSDLDVTPLALGTMYFSWRDTDERSLQRLDQYAEAGGNFLDTANVYSQHWLPGDWEGADRDRYTDGMSERLVGRWLAESGTRQRMVVATKVGFPYPGQPAGTTPEQIRTECERSLERLQTDHIDLYYLHNDDRTVPLDQTLGALADLVTEGKVRAIGASNFAAWRLAQAHGIADRLGYPHFSAVQQRHTYLRPRPGTTFGGPGGQMPTTEDLLDFVREDGIQLIAYSPLMSGAYQDPRKPIMLQYRGVDSDGRVRMLHRVAEELGATPNQVVYAWMLASDPMALPLVAASTTAQFNEALGALDLHLDAETMTRLDGAGEDVGD